MKRKIIRTFWFVTKSLKSRKSLRNLVKNAVIFLPLLKKEAKYFFYNIYIFLNFLIANKKKNCVLLIEVNPFHGEVLPGLAKYFIDLNFKVDVICNKEIAKENPFCFFDSPHLRVFAPSFLMLKFIVKNLDFKFKNYNHIVLTSTKCYSVRHSSVLAILPNLHKYSLSIVEHDLANVSRFKETFFVEHNKLITLGKLDSGIFVNPHYFGNISIDNNEKKNVFITVGAILPLRKNHQLLINTVTELIQYTTNFKIVVIGQGSIDSIPKEIQPYFSIKGRLDFYNMYLELSKANFFLPLLDSNNPDHDRYITTGVTGSSQLIYGFNIVPLIESKFAGFYGFNEKNSFIYSNNLVNTMLSAIKITQDEYENKRKKLLQLSNTIYDESIKNVKNILF